MSHALQNLEEINSSRSGIKMLKKAGLLKEDIKKLKISYNKLQNTIKDINKK